MVATGGSKGGGKEDVEAPGLYAQANRTRPSAHLPGGHVCRGRGPALLRANFAFIGFLRTSGVGGSTKFVNK